MLRSAALASMIVLLCAEVSRADGVAGAVEWRTGLAETLAEAKRVGRPVFVAINNVIAEGEGVEVASKHLREEVYTDPRLVALSKEFLCVLLRSPVTTEDGGELRERYGIDGMIVTPQHLLLHANGRLVQRKEYWEHRTKDASVEALSAMMGRALKAHAARTRLPELGADPASRSAWIQAAVELVRAGPDVDVRRAAANELAAVDSGGDCYRALAGVLASGADPGKDATPLYVDVVRILGRPGLEDAVAGLGAMLDAKDPAIRANAAVSLEYVGSVTSVETLLKRLGKEKDEAVRSHVLRALGRCGAKQAPVRKVLMKEAVAKSDLVAAGAILGLAYFEGDADAARSLEKTVKGNDQGLRRAATLWTLAAIGDGKTAEALRVQLAETAPVLPSYRQLEAAIAVLGGDEGRRQELDRAVQWALAEKLPRPETVRSGRDAVGFTPKGDPGARSD